MLLDDDKLPILPAEHHWEWLDLFCDDSIKKLLIISPPGSAKTTWLIQAYLGCRLGFYPDQNSIIGSVTDEVAEKRSLSLRGDIESELWHEIFPDIIKNDKLKWEQREWSIKNRNSVSTGKLHPTVVAYGVGSSSIGGRADILFGDDLLSKENTYTQGQRDRFADWLESAFLTRLKPNGRVILIGTAWNAADYYAKIRRENKGWTIVHCNSHQENGFFIYIHRPEKATQSIKIHSDNVLWKEHLSEEGTLAIKNTTQDHVWQTTWQGYPTSPHGQIFQREWWSGKNRFNVGEGDVSKYYLSIDAALTDKDTAAKSAIVMGELTPKYQLRIPLVWAEHATFYQLLDKLTELTSRYNFFRIIIENAALGVPLIQDLKAKPNVADAIREFNPRVAKDARWQWASKYCRNDCILLPHPTEKVPWLADFESKLYEAPDVDKTKRDELDAFSQLVIFVEPFLQEGLKKHG